MAEPLKITRLFTANALFQDQRRTFDEQSHPGITFELHELGVVLTHRGQTRLVPWTGIAWAEVKPLRSGKLPA